MTLGQGDLLRRDLLQEILNGNLRLLHGIVADVRAGVTDNIAQVEIHCCGRHTRCFVFVGTE